MRIAEFGGADSDGYSVGVITGWLESLIQDEEEACEASQSQHRRARLDRAHDALQALYEVGDWSPKLTREQNKRGKQSLHDDPLRKP